MIKLLETRQEYFDFPALNNSTLKKFASDPSNILNSGELTSDELTFGSAVDMLLFDGIEEFEKNFGQITVPEPTAHAGKLAEALLSDSIFRTSDAETMQDLAKVKVMELDLWKSTKKMEDKIANYNTPNFWSYITQKIQNLGKTSLSTEDYQKVQQVAINLKTNGFTSKFYFADTLFGKEVKFQVPVVFDYLDVTCKVMFDHILIDHDAKHITKADTKTTSDNPLHFKNSFIKYRYDIQSELYSRGAEAYRDLFYPDYTLDDDFTFIVASSINPTKAPVVYNVNPIKFREDFNAKSAYPLKSLTELIEDFKWHSKSGQWVYPKEYYTNGFIRLV